MEYFKNIEDLFDNVGDKNVDESYIQELAEKKLTIKLKKGKHYDIYRGEMSEGFDVYLDSLPKDIVRLRFYNTY